MRRHTYRLFRLISQVVIVAGTGVAAVWNVGSLFLGLPDLGWWGLLAPLPGLVMWGITLALPGLLSGATAIPKEAYRLVYASPEGWDDERSRTALLNLARQAGGIEIVWVRETQGSGCWLNVPEAWQDVLARLVSDVFPEGQIERGAAPLPGEGVVILRVRKGRALPPPDVLCEQEGIEGVYFRWQNRDTAVVSIWGDKAPEIALQYAKKGDNTLPGAGKSLQRPRFSGRNPWPLLPPFPAPERNPGLIAVSRFERLAPKLRSPGSGLNLGKDTEGEKIGFSFPELPGSRSVRIIGADSARLTARLAYQGFRARLPVCVLDGDGEVVNLLARLAMRELAQEEALLCDLERPAQGDLRFNPFWLPEARDDWPAVLAIWRVWLKELGVTPAGLGTDAYRHTLAAVVLTAKAAIERGLTFDPEGLRQALEAPEFLTTLRHNGASALFSAADWAWWQSPGQQTPNFDVHLRLGHLRERLSSLLELPEYSVLWKAPYLALPDAFETRRALFWRLTGQKGHRSLYISSLLMSLEVALSVYRRKKKPVLLFIHNLDTGLWAERLHQFQATRLFLSGEQWGVFPALPRPQTLIVSRLNKDDAEKLYPKLTGTRAADLRRLPPGRLIVRRGRHLGTATMGV